jgi:hypothetical protein
LPTYSFYDEEHQAEFDKFMSMSELDEFLAANPRIRQIPGLPVAFVDPIRAGITKPSIEFRERLKEIQKAHSGGITKSTINSQ